MTITELWRNQGAVPSKFDEFVKANDESYAGYSIGRIRGNLDTCPIP